MTRTGRVGVGVGDASIIRTNFDSISFYSLRGCGRGYNIFVASNLTISDTFICSLMIYLSDAIRSRLKQINNCPFSIGINKGLPVEKGRSQSQVERVQALAIIHRRG